MLNMAWETPQGKMFSLVFAWYELTGSVFVLLSCFCQCWFLVHVDEILVFSMSHYIKSSKLVTNLLKHHNIYIYIYIYIETYIEINNTGFMFLSYMCLL